jgi:hypothetical protein
LPCTSSALSLILRKAWSSSCCKSANETSNTRPFNPSEAICHIRPKTTTAYHARQVHHSLTQNSNYKENHPRKQPKPSPTLVPAVLVTSVLPNDLCVKMVGALISYQSFLENGSTLHSTKSPSLHQRQLIPTNAQTKEIK